MSALQSSSQDPAQAQRLAATPAHAAVPAFVSGRRTGLPAPIEVSVVDDVVRRALKEDIETGDLTSTAAVPARARARAKLVAKSDGVIAGLSVFARTFSLCDPDCAIDLRASDGDPCSKADVLCVIEGDAQSMLAAERTALNLIQRMSGVATLTASFVARAGGSARVLDTRKTNPTLRTFDKYAVRCGGGENHRYGLFDEVMLKENHIDLAGRPLVDVVRSVRETVGPDIRITCEARDEAEAENGIRGGADVILLDNMTPAEMSAMIPRLRNVAAELGRAVELEASGGVDEATVGAIAQTGVDRISVGALTHSAPALDLSLYLEPMP